MSDQTLVFGGMTPWERPDRPVGEERKSARSLIAAVVAGGLALSASLYPSVGEVPIPGFLDLPKVARALGLPVLTDGLPTRRTAEAKQADLAELLHLATIIARNPQLVPAEVLRALVQTPGFLELLDRVGMDGTAPGGVDFGRNFFAGFVGGGGGGGGSMALPGTLAEWLFFLDVLLHRLPVRVLVQLSAALTRMVPEPVAVESVVQATELIQTVAVVLPPPETVPALPPAQSVAPVAPELVGPAPTLIVTVETPVVPVVMETPTPPPPPPPPVVELVPEVVITPPPVVIPTDVTPDPVIEIPPPEEPGVVDLPPVIDDGLGEDPTEVPPADWDNEPDETPSVPGDSDSTTGEPAPEPDGPADDPSDGDGGDGGGGGGGGGANASALRFSAGVIGSDDGVGSNSVSAAALPVLELLAAPAPIDVPTDVTPDSVIEILLPEEPGVVDGESGPEPDAPADEPASAAPLPVLELLITPTPAPIDVPTDVTPDPVIEIPRPEEPGVVDVPPVIDGVLGEAPAQVLPADWDAEADETPSLPADSESLAGATDPESDVPADGPGDESGGDGLGGEPTEIPPADWDDEPDQTPAPADDFDSTAGESDLEADVLAEDPDDGDSDGDGDGASASTFSASGSRSDDGSDDGSDSSSASDDGSASDGDSSSGDSANE